MAKHMVRLRTSINWILEISHWNHKTPQHLMLKNHNFRCQFTMNSPWIHHGRPVSVDPTSLGLPSWLTGDVWEKIKRFSGTPHLRLGWWWIFWWDRVSICFCSRETLGKNCTFLCQKMCWRYILVSPSECCCKILFLDLTLVFLISVSLNLIQDVIIPNPHSFYMTVPSRFQIAKSPQTIYTCAILNYFHSYKKKRVKHQRNFSFWADHRTENSCEIHRMNTKTRELYQLYLHKLQFIQKVTLW